MKKKLNRSTAGNIGIFCFLGLFGLYMAVPLIYTISNAFKPLDEFFLFPPRLLVRNPTLNNFADLFGIVSTSWVPFSRYLFNSIFIVALGTGGHVVLASMAAFPLAKNEFPGKGLLFTIVVLSLMFAPEVTAIPNFLIMARLNLLNSYWSLILPAIVFPLGLFLMKQFMANIPITLIESARIEGADDWKVLWTIVMPIVKPAWLTLILFNFNYTWTAVSSGLGAVFIFDEEIKPLPFMLSQITAGFQFSWMGITSAVYFILLVVPITVFILTQRRVIETMSSSGIKE